MKRLSIILGIFALSAIFAPPTAIARAGTLVKCDYINTREGGRYVGTYCADYQCSYHIRQIFTGYCPFMI